MPAEKTQKTLRTVEWRQRDQFQIYTGKKYRIFKLKAVFKKTKKNNFRTILFLKVNYSVIKITQRPISQCRVSYMSEKVNIKINFLVKPICFLNVILTLRKRKL